MNHYFIKLLTPLLILLNQYKKEHEDISEISPAASNTETFISKLKEFKSERKVSFEEHSRTESKMKKLSMLENYVYFERKRKRKEDSNKWFEDTISFLKKLRIIASYENSMKKFKSHEIFLSRVF